MRYLLSIVAIVSLFSVGCGNKDKAKKLAGLCVDATKMLAEESGSADGDTFMQMLQNALNACSGACDEKDDASCQALDAHLTKICGVNADTCDALCGSVKSPSLKKYSCAHGTKK